MIDVKQVRANPERLKEIIRQRKVDPSKADVDAWLKLDEKRRDLQAKLEALQAEQNKSSTLWNVDKEAARNQGRELREKLRAIEEELSEVSEKGQAIFDWFPNWIDPNMPVGESDADNVLECAWVPNSGYIDKNKLQDNAKCAELMPKKLLYAKDADFTPVGYADLGERLGIDTPQGGKVSGSRFAYILGDVAVMQMALAHLLTEKLLNDGFQPIIPPLLVRERALYGTSHFPEGRDQVYVIKTHNVEDEHQLHLVGSSEPANFSYFMDKTINEAELPIKVFAYTPCFRSEAGSWGKDVKGIKRVHQFDKIEMNAVCTPEQSDSIYQQFKDVNEWLLQTLKLPYRIIDKCTGDAGYLATYRQRDVEVWLPASREFLETMTDTNTTDYQARRLNIRYKSEQGKPQYCHTVNDTCCAMGRMLIAIIENYQQADGSILIPEALRAFMKKEYILPMFREKQAVRS